MASNKEYLAFILEQLSDVSGVTHRAMMGEYIIYLNGKIVGGIYDDRFLVKKTEAAERLMPEAPLESPYEGAKPMYLVDNVDNRKFLRELLEAVYAELPEPKKKKQVRKKEIRTSVKTVDMEKYYRKGVYRHFTDDCKCSVSMTARIDVTELIRFSRRTGTKFYINFLYVLSRALNSREDYRMRYLWQTNEVVCYDTINPIQYVFHEDTETFTVVYSTYYEDYPRFCREAAKDLERAKNTREYGLDPEAHPNWFDASFIPWVSYDSLNIELPDGYLYYAPIVNWGAYREENRRFMMPVTVRLNHAVADGYLVAKVFRLIEDGIRMLIEQKGAEEI